MQDSRGGDPIASDTILNAIEYVQDALGKPVVASFGSVAASGGYFIASSAARIVANPGLMYAISCNVKLTRICFLQEL